jgi:LacI family transcriptional regulator
MSHRPDEPARPAGPVTQGDIAEATGYSLPTVSRVLSNSGYPVRPQVRAEILETAARLGYRPNLTARGLRTRRTGTVGVVVDDIMSPFVPPIVRGIQDCLLESDLFCMVVNADWNPETERAAIGNLLARPVDGILFVEYSHQAVDAALARSGTPHLFVHRLFGSPIKNSVVPDDAYGAALAVRHLIGLGHRRIAFVAGPMSWHNARARYAGYADTLAAHGIALDPALVREGTWESASGYAAATALLALPDRPTALLAANDLMALGAIYAVQDAGLSVPGDLAVVGYDNRDFTRIVRPQITSVSMPVYEMGRLAAELLVRQIRDGRREADEIKVPGQLYVRESCGADPARRTPEAPVESALLRRLVLNRAPEA